jgi:prolyl oligopeptidase
VDVLHGTPVADPYRGLEDGDDQAVMAWVDAQNAHTDRVLARSARRAGFRSRTLELLRLPVSGGPVVGGELVFTLDRRNGRDQAVLAARSRSQPGPARVVLDPVLATDDETGAIDWFEPSPDGSLVAVGLSVGGDERSTLHVVRTDDDRFVDEPIPGTRAASVGWWPDSDGFAYTRYPAPGTVASGREVYGRHVRDHALGDDPAEDPILFEPTAHGHDLDDTAWPDVRLARDGRWALVHVAVGWSRTDVHLLDRVSGVWTTVIAGTEARSGFEVDGDRLVGVTTAGADRGRVVAAPLTRPEPASWRTLVDEPPDAVIESVVRHDDGLLVWSSVDAVARLDRHEPDGTRRRPVSLPELGAIVGLDAEPGRADAFVTVTSFARPATLFRVTDGTLTPWSGEDDGPDPQRYHVVQASYPSTDGTEIPMFLVHRRDLAPGSDTRCLLTAYGGFAIANAPAFSPLAVAWCDDGGLVAVANIRGGGERGEAWHEAGRRAHKTTVYEDFEAAADWLVDRGRTTRDRLAIRGGSNGGLLVGAAITRRPDLCAAAHAAVPLMDMVRYPEFEIARLWIPEYGDPAEPDEFAWLIEYSPYHRVVDGTCYPATLLSAGAGDSRVDPMHARKMAARLQAATSCGAEHPILLRQEDRAGHGQGKPVGRQADEMADVLAFFDTHLAPGRVGTEGGAG